MSLTLKVIEVGYARNHADIRKKAFHLHRCPTDLEDIMVF